MYPENLVVFNANLCTRDKKIWYGDLDLTLDRNKLLELAVEMDDDIYVLYEMDARFENEKNFKVENAVAVFTRMGKAEVGEKYKEYYKL